MQIFPNTTKKSMRFHAVPSEMWYSVNPEVVKVMVHADSITTYLPGYGCNIFINTAICIGNKSPSIAIK